MNRLAGWLATPVLLAVSCMVLLSAVIFGGSFSDGRIFSSFGSGALLGTTLERAGIAPLTDRFVDQVLGPGATSAVPKVDPAGSRGRDALGGADEGAGEVVDHAFTNNNQANAYDVKRLPFTGRTSTADADREAGEPECGTQLGGTVWYRYKATRTEALLADTFGTGYQTSLAAYRQTSSGPAGLNNTCDFDPQGNSQIKVDVNSGTTYLFQIGAAVRGGALTFNLKRFGATLLASLSTRDEPGNARSVEPSLSFDGRYVAFASQATNLDPGARRGDCDTDILEEYPGETPCYNIFLRDRQAGTTKLVSARPDGKGGDNGSGSPAVSDDGRYVVFHSDATDLVPDDTNNAMDVFIRDMRTGRIERMTVNSSGEQADAGGSFPSMSADGRFVGFSSVATNLTEEIDNDHAQDAFVRDRWNGTTQLVSVDDEGRHGQLHALVDSISRNGRWVVFFAEFPVNDVFVRDLWTGTTELVSVPEASRELEALRPAALTVHASQRSISDDGRFVVFGSDGALVDGDGNNALDVFVRDRLLQTTERVSVSSSGTEGVAPTFATADNIDYAISGDGRTVVFESSLNLLEPSDGNNRHDVFVHDRAHRVTRRLTGNPDRESGFLTTGESGYGLSPRISGDGMLIAFHNVFPLSRRDTNDFEDVFLFSPLALAEQAVHSPGCTIGEGGCFPTPEECATGEFNGYHYGGTPGRGAVCASSGGMTIAYIGGNANTNCGTTVVLDQTATSSGIDPNNCAWWPPPDEVPPDTTIRSFRAPAP